MKTPWGNRRKFGSETLVFSGMDFGEGAPWSPWGFWKKSDVVFVSLPTCVEL